MNKDSQRSMLVYKENPFPDLAKVTTNDPRWPKPTGLSNRPCDGLRGVTLSSKQLQPPCPSSVPVHQVRSTVCSLALAHTQVAGR